MQSIAFYPVIISTFFFFFAVASMSADKLGVVSNLRENFPYLFIDDYETARSVLNTFVGGIISLIVFSFTMVMVVLNQTSANFSPRLLPNLISNKTHQLILGFYIGTLLYIITVLISQGATHDGRQDSLGISIMISALLGFLCIGLFIFFIHNISQAVQVQNIILRIYRKASLVLDRAKEEQSPSDKSMKDRKYVEIASGKTGYYRGFEESVLHGPLKQKQGVIEVIPYIDEHIWEGDVVLRVDEGLTEEEIESLLFAMDISHDRQNPNSGNGGMVMLMEVAVKAMSPGINDPGTAIEAVRKMGQLMHRSLQLHDTHQKTLKDFEFDLILHNISSAQLVEKMIQPVYNYCKNDKSVSSALIETINYLVKSTKISAGRKKALKQELATIKNEFDKKWERPTPLKS
ncbi:DUF2254 domain-containing protein [Abyssalbus ytuae]|uniref:DUF2254 domain-containing protein n=1 Tax=Abyssalbus ytuae TaxID=2926907 RepID=A0A9E6ZRG9_9FLAO|nr:DUF2254 domain-containing protein [Abyssalbus ytuae]UOB17478.1 DUF2254 domain-containing protein [Abyssalbus ytuae]